MPDLPQRVRRIVEMLPEPSASEDALPLGNKPDPYDELVYILLSNMTRHPPRIHAAFDRLVELREGEAWGVLLDVDIDEIREALTPLGFVNRRTDQLLGIVREVEKRWGGTLDVLRDMSDAEAIATLTSLKGVGVKTAKCVLMYSLGREVLPVDIHVLRVGKRLGLVPDELSWKEADAFLEAEVPGDIKFDVHVQFVIHGREVCKSPTPLCNDCVLLDICPTGGFPAEQRDVYTGAASRPGHDR